jgi:nucleoside-diphosphate-sugar epimerase
MRIFVTGATGYIGRALCRRLVAEGHEVRALVRSTSRVEPLAEIGVSTSVGDIGDRASMREGMSGADWVIHAAAELDLGVPAARMAAINVAGSENVASLAYKLGVGRFLSVSSVAYWGGSPADGSLANEDAKIQEPLPTAYSATKYAGERAIQEWAKRGLRVNTVFPSLVYGPPGKKEGANALLRAIFLGRYPALVGADQKTSWVFLDDLVDGMLAVMAKSAPGRGYLFAGDIVTVRQLAQLVESHGGAKAPRLNLPPGLVQVLLRLTTPLYRLRGRRPPMEPQQVRSLARHWAFDDTRARTELGWQARPLSVGLPATIPLFRTPPAPTA